MIDEIKNKKIKMTKANLTQPLKLVIMIIRLDHNIKDKSKHGL
jgi:hypothetical protein